MIICKPTGYYKNVYLNNEDYASTNEARFRSRMKLFWLGFAGIIISLVFVTAAIYYFVL